MEIKVPKITVIVPCYKAAGYLGLCCSDLKKQSFTDFEVILVDDGSPDDTGALCDQISESDTRFRVIHQENGGVGRARQTGLQYARGEYLIHVDPDDRVDSEMLEGLYLCMKSNHADMVICDFYEIRDEGEVYVNQAPKSLLHSDVLMELFDNLHGSCCNKLVKKQLFSDFNLSFPKLAILEDLYINVALLLNPIKVVYLDKAFYHYDRTNANSVTRKGNSDMGINAYNACEAFRHLLDGKDDIWAKFIRCEMPWMAYLTLYYGSVTEKEFKSQYIELLSINDTSMNGHLVHAALKYNYGIVRTFVKLYKFLSRII